MILTDLTVRRQVAYGSKHFCNETVRLSPYDEAISLRLILMMPAIMLPPLSVARLTLISVKSFCFYSLMFTSLFTVKTLLPFDGIYWEIGIPVCWRVRRHGNLTANLSYLISRESSYDSTSSINKILLFNTILRKISGSMNTQRN